MFGAVVCLTGVAFIAHPTWLFGAQENVDTTDSNDSGLVLKALAVLITEAGAASTFSLFAFVLHALVLVFCSPLFSFDSGWACICVGQENWTQNVASCHGPLLWRLVCAHVYFRFWIAGGDVESLSVGFFL